MKLGGTVTPPADMVAAARRDLSPLGFQALMQLTNGQPPTPAQLVKAVEAERNDDRAEFHPS